MMLKHDHLIRMTKQEGLVQFCRGTVPDLSSGFTLDDNARAAILTLSMPHSLKSRLLPVYEQFMKKSVRFSGGWHNFMNESGNFPPSETASGDSRGRAFQAYCLLYPQQQKKFLFQPELYFHRLIQGILPVLNTASPSLRAQAYILLGINSLHSCKIQDNSIFTFFQSIRKHITNYFLSAYQQNVSHSWKWYEPSLTYCNGILPHALLSCPDLPEYQVYLNTARDSLLFLCDLLFRDGYLNIIGNHGWFKKGMNKPPLFDQQPVDAASTALCCLAAYQCFHEKCFLEWAVKAQNWFCGENIHQLSLIDEKSGGCFDALTADGVNQNQGAESLLAYLMTFYAVENAQKESHGE